MMKRGFRERLHRLHCGFRDTFGIAPPDTLNAIRRIRINERPLKAAYMRSPLSNTANDFALYRIIGNDLPPRHQARQSIRNLRFILEHEPALPSCEKRFVLNRITDQGIEAEIIALLKQAGFTYLHIPFDPKAYQAIPLDYECLPRPGYLDSKAFQKLPARHRIRLLTAVNRHRNNYVMHNNGARNRAIGDGRKRAKWVLPFDGNCFFTASAWDELRECVGSRPWLPYFIVPMARITDNQILFDDSFSPSPVEEPQLMFRCDARERFNEAFPYGRFPKIELFWRLGIPGAWSYTVEKAWDPPRRPLSPEAFQFGLAGWVARLNSGVQDLELAGPQGPSQRGDARREGILDLLSSLDERIFKSSPINSYRPVSSQS